MHTLHRLHVDSRCIMQPHKFYAKRQSAQPGYALSCSMSAMQPQRVMLEPQVLMTHLYTIFINSFQCWQQGNKLRCRARLPHKATDGNLWVSCEQTAGPESKLIGSVAVSMQQQPPALKVPPVLCMTLNIQPVSERSTGDIAVVHAPQGLSTIIVSGS